MIRPAPRHQSAYSVPTTIDGVRYRSRLEARWALFFRTLGLDAAYELQPYRLPSGVYVPDFWLPSLSLHVEVKPTAHTTAMLARLAELAHGTQKSVGLLVGPPDVRAYDLLLPTGRLAHAALRFPVAPHRLQVAVHTALAARFAA